MLASQLANSSQGNKTQALAKYFQKSTRILENFARYLLFQNLHTYADCMYDLFSMTRPWWLMINPLYCYPIFHELLYVSLKKSLLVELNFKIGDQNLERLVKAMAQSDILSYRQQKFTKNLFLFVILPIITKPCKLEDKEMSIILKINDKCKNSCHFMKFSFKEMY